jgi:transcriptional regulator with XRE-family HTH domain
LRSPAESDILRAMTGPPEPQLGRRLRSLREQRGKSLREIERVSSINSGYLSQLERGAVAQPTPSMIQRLSEAYDIPLPELMSWAGYSMPESKMTPSQARALKYIGDPSDEEVEAIRAVLDVLRKRSAFDPARSLDLTLSKPEVQVIRDHAAALLREASVDAFPTPLDDLMAVAKLVQAGEISLSVNEKRSLRARLGDRWEHALRKLHGLIAFDSGEVWLDPDLVLVKTRFVHAHEIGHHILPAHREIAYLDDWQSLASDVRDACEREANQASIELLAQGDRLRAVGDDSRFGRAVVTSLASTAQISLQATARRLAEESDKPCAAVVIYQHGPPHIYTSESFEREFRWKSGLATPPDLISTLRQSGSALSAPLVCLNAYDRSIELRCEALSTPRALIGLVARDPGRVLGKVFPLRK